MTLRTWIRDEFEAYLESEYPLHKEGSAAVRTEEARERNMRLQHFPHSVLSRLTIQSRGLAPASRVKPLISIVRHRKMQIRAIGAHLPQLDQDGISKFIREKVERFKRTLYDLNQTSSIQTDPAEIEERALELPEELDYDLQRCALFELEVTGNESEFDPSEYGDPESGSLGWEPAFLSPDGAAIICEAYKAPASLRNFRVAFYVHEWQSNGRLVGPTGEMELPTFTPVPERLWQLAPYSCVD